MDNYSIIAVLVGGVAFFALGALWYMALFRKPWAEDMGITISAEGEPPAAPPVSDHGLVRAHRLGARRRHRILHP